MKYIRGHNFKNRGITQRLSIEHIRKEVESKGDILISSEYKNCYSRLEILFKECGHIWEAQWTNYQQGHRCGNPHCRAKHQNNKLVKMPRGPRNHRWNPSANYRESNSPGIGVWVQRVFKRDSFICKKCLQKSGDIEAHHIKPYALFEEERTVLENGITLCNLHHKEYHAIYGKTNKCNKETLTLWLLSSCNSTAFQAIILQM